MRWPSGQCMEEVKARACIHPSNRANFLLPSGIKYPNAIQMPDSSLQLQSAGAPGYGMGLQDVTL